MGSQRFLIVLVVAVVVAAGAGFGVWRLLQASASAERVPMSTVIVAAADLTEGKRIELMDVRSVSMPTASVPAGAFAEMDSVVGRVTRLAVFAGEAMLPGRLAPQGTSAGLEVKIAPGKRAMAVKIDEVAGLAGLIQPNSRVDVLVTLVDPSGERQRAKLIMSNMRVLSIGSQVERGPDGRAMNATTAALEVTPIEAEELAIASNQGRIQLVLRGYGDPDTVVTRGATVSDVLRSDASSSAPPSVQQAAQPARRRSASRPRPALAPEEPVPSIPVAPPPRRPDSSVVQVYRGDKVTQQKVQRPDTIRPN